MSDHKNTILAVVLSLLVIVGWQYFIGYPQVERQRQETQSKAARAVAGPARTQPATPQPNAATSRRKYRERQEPDTIGAGANRVARSGDCVIAADRDRDTAARRQHRS